MSESKEAELTGSSEEQSSVKEELFSGSLEQSADENSTDSEKPQQAAESEKSVEKTEASGDKKAGENPTPETSEDSELGNLFEALEKDVPETDKARLLAVKKKTQAFLTKARQGDAAKLKDLEANQISNKLKEDYSTLYGWYEKVNSNPAEGIRQLATQFGLDLKALVIPDRATPENTELTPDGLVTAEDYAKFSEQVAEKKIKPLLDKIQKLESFIEKSETESVRSENVKRGAEKLSEAAKLPGFVKEDGSYSENAIKAIDLVMKGGFSGEHAVVNAYKSVSSDTYSTKVSESETRIKELENEIASIKQNLKGSHTPPDTKHNKTTMLPSRPESLWNDLRKEPLLPT